MAQNKRRLEKNKNLSLQLTSEISVNSNPKLDLNTAHVNSVLCLCHSLGTKISFEKYEGLTKLFLSCKE